ncbi:MAG: hypothetical protein NT002_03795 [candidate division Zixibacteria bacterium]|nr:hypothetical protein [candidate division Zixibacteria bacterium]
MNTFLLLLCAVFLVMGLVLGFLARKHRAANAPPMPSYNPIHWVQPWKVNEWFTPTGVKLYFTSYTCIMIGVVLLIISGGFDFPFK